MIRHRILIDEASLRNRVREMAKQIAIDLGRRQPILIGILRGSFVFMADLIRELSLLGIDPKIDFLSASHYGQTRDASRTVRIQPGPLLSIAAQAILVVDDILDTGESLARVVAHLERENPIWLRTCVLLDKPSRRTVPVHLDYVGFQVPDVWLIGYGLDLGEEGRGLPYVGAVEDS